MKEEAPPTDAQIKAVARALAAKHWHWDRLGEKERDSLRACTPEDVRSMESLGPNLTASSRGDRG